MVRGTFSGLTTALSALQANQKRLDITGHNLTNMSTPGYTRQQLDVSSIYYNGPSHHAGDSSGVVGFGASMDGISQIRDPFLDAQYRSQTSTASYSDAIQTALDSISSVLDTSNFDGMELALADINAKLSQLQDPPKNEIPGYEDALLKAMNNFTSLLNDAANDIGEAEQAEYDRLSGTSNELGAVPKVNDLLRQIGDLNVQIKSNQVMGMESLEMTDERNRLLDELSSYIPIKVSYVKDPEHTGFVTDTDGNVVNDANGNPRERMYEYDSRGNVIGKKSWPDDVKVEMQYQYTDEDGKPQTQTLTLINGTEGGKGNNYGSIKMTAGSNRDDPTAAKVEITAAASTVPEGDPVPSTTLSATDSQLKDGSIQASLDMLGKSGQDGIRGYQYYTQRLNDLAGAFAKKMNDLNKAGTPDPDNNPYLLLVNGENQTEGGITAANISISDDWLNDTVHIGTYSSGTDNVGTNNTVLDMMAAMENDDNNLGFSFIDYAVNTGTTLASDSSANQQDLVRDVSRLNTISTARDSISGVSLDEEGANMMAYVSAYNAASRLMTAMDEMLNTLISNTGLVGR